ncbi:hypothetical protein Taro_004548 [Colocasia esculenta]|uniref:DUF1308 domain-containing protein n=1 Tax=Colocasia esculenta TaxID=4460 RepID=A0A843TV68_COLES|nr:hypothetical protein [Colocasia esculenta]
MADASNASPPEIATAASLEVARARCAGLRDRVSGTLPSSKISDSCRGTLLRLLGAELRFLSRLSPSDVSPPFSLNVGYLESIVHIVEQPSVTRVSRICKSLVPPPARASSSQHPWKTVHVDIVCTLCQRPAWFLVSDRNPKYISWLGSRRGDGAGLRARVERVVSAARSTVYLKPESVVLFFAKGVGDAISEKLVGEFGASEMANQFSCPDFHTFQELEDGWVNVIGPVSRAFEIKVDTERYAGETVVKVVEEDCVENKKNDLSSSNEFYSLISRLKPSSNKELINFDTTALIALVSGISNGGTGHLFKADEVDMRKRFKGNYDFVMAQAMSELQNPILSELNNVIDGRKGIVCESTLSEFKDIVTMCGGASEKERAEQLLRSLVVVPDSPSARIIGLPTTRKIGLKNKVIFGTGDHWHAPTLTANIGFVRAISQTGMSLLTMEHSPRALIGD